MILSLNKKVLKNFEKVTLFSPNELDKIEVTAKVDTGADRSSIDRELAEKLHLLDEKNIVETKEYKSGLGKEKREIVNLKYIINGKTIKAQVSVARRGHLRFPMLIGVLDMKGFLVDPDRSTL